MSADGRRGHVSVSRHWLSDPALSDRDLRLMLWLDSHTDSYLERLNASTTAEQLGWSRNTVKKSLANLAGLDLISTEQHRVKGGGTRTHITLHLDVWTDGQSLTSAVVKDCASALVKDCATTYSKSNSEESNIETAPSTEVEVLHPSDFELFWHDYPRKIGKPVAEKKFEKAAKEFGADTVIGGTLAWREFWSQAGTAEEYIPHPSTFLHQHRFNDRPPKLPDKSDAMSVLHRMANRNQ